MNAEMFVANWIVMACFIYANFWERNNTLAMKRLRCKVVFLETEGAILEASLGQC